MGLDATVYRNRKHLPDHLPETVIVDPASGAMDLRDPAHDRISGKAKREAWHERVKNMAVVALLGELEKITASSRSQEPTHFISQVRSLIAAGQSRRQRYRPLTFSRGE